MAWRHTVCLLAISMALAFAKGTGPSTPSIAEPPSCAAEPEPTNGSNVLLQTPQMVLTALHEEPTEAELLFLGRFLDGK
eukprot:Skav230209  [mRNA]  locus=scaffold1765:29305:30317:- [translate_table: standard]